MKLYRIPISKEFKPYLTTNVVYSKDENLLTFHFATHLKRYDLDKKGIDVFGKLEVNLNELREGFYEMVFSPAKKEFKASFFESLRNAGSLNGLPEKDFPSNKRLLSEFCTGYFTKESNGEVQIFLSVPSEKIEGFEDNIIEIGDDWIGLKEFIRNHSEKAKSEFETYFKKSKLFRFIDYKDSIGYLEAQIDILTRFILEKFKDDKDEKTKKMLDFLKKSDEDGCSLLSLKSVESLTESAIHNKRVFRKAQKEYLK